MKFSKTAFSIFILTFLFSAVPAFAQTATPTGVPRPPHKVNDQEIRQEIKTERQDLRNTVTQKRLSSRIQNAIKIGKKIVAQLEKRLEYLNKIRSRLTEKAGKLTDTNSKNAVNAVLANYDKLVSGDYATHLKTLNSAIDSIETLEKPNSIIPTLRTDAKAVQTDLQKLHQYLVDALKLIVKAPKPSPTITP